MFVLQTREELLMPMYHQVAVYFADLHDTPGRMDEMGVISVCIVQWLECAYCYVVSPRKDINTGILNCGLKRYIHMNYLKLIHILKKCFTWFIRPTFEVCLWIIMEFNRCYYLLLKFNNPWSSWNKFVPFAFVRLPTSCQMMLCWETRSILTSRLNYQNDKIFIYT